MVFRELAQLGGVHDQVGGGLVQRAVLTREQLLQDGGYGRRGLARQVDGTLERLLKPRPVVVQLIQELTGALVNGALVRAAFGVYALLGVHSSFTASVI